LPPIPETIGRAGSVTNLTIPSRLQHVWTDDVVKPKFRSILVTPLTLRFCDEAPLLALGRNRWSSGRKHERHDHHTRPLRGLRGPL